MSTNAPTLSLSIVSHGQIDLIQSLLQGMRVQGVQLAELIVTLNLPEPFDEFHWSGPGSLICLRNPHPQGFGANHNAAFRHAQGDYFCVLNPDIRLETNPFPVLIQALQNPQVGIAAPMVCNPAGEMEDSVRRFPHPGTILTKAAGRAHQSDYTLVDAITQVDWVGGMCMVFRRDAFAQLGGFDEGYFLYYEDVDVCARAARVGLQVVACREARVIHDARRHSHRNLRYMRWHLVSMARFFVKRLAWAVQDRVGA